MLQISILLGSSKSFALFSLIFAALLAALFCLTTFLFRLLLLDALCLGFFVGGSFGICLGLLLCSYLCLLALNFRVFSSIP